MKTKTKKRLFKPIQVVAKLLLKFVQWLRAKISQKDAEIEAKVFSSETMREIRQKVQTLKDVVKKYDYRKGRLVWNSRKWGTYVIEKHGILK